MPADTIQFETAWEAPERVALDGNYAQPSAWPAAAALRVSSGYGLIGPRTV